MTNTKVQMRSRKSLLFQSSNNKNRNKQFNSKTLVFSKPYSSAFSSIINIFYRYLPVLNKVSKLHTIHEVGCKVVSRKGKTLGNLLSLSEIVENKPNTWLFNAGFFLCSDRRCNVCRFTTRRSKFEKSVTTKYTK